MNGTEVFGDAFAFTVGGTGQKRIRRTQVIFWDVRKLGRLFSVNGTGAGEEELFNAALRREIQHAAGAAYDGVEHLLRGLVVELGARFRRRVDDVGKLSGRESEGSDVALDKGEVGAGGEVRGFPGKGGGVAGQDGGARAEAEGVVGVDEAFQQPHAEEAGAAGDEKGLAARLRPQLARVRQHVSEVFEREGFYGSEQSRTASLSGTHKIADYLDLVGEHGGSESGIGAKEDRAVHDFVGTSHLADHAEGVGAVFLELHEDGLAKKVTAEKHTVSDFLFVEVAGEVGVAEAGGGFDTEHEAEPRGVSAATGGIPGERIGEGES